MKPASAKAKGRKLQQWVADHIGRITGLSVGPDEDIESRPMGQAGVDIRLSPAAREAFPFSIECKNQKRFAMVEFLKQARDNQVKGTDWLLVCKLPRDRPTVTMDAEEFFAIIEEWMGDKEAG